MNNSIQNTEDQVMEDASSQGNLQFKKSLFYVYRTIKSTWRIYGSSEINLRWRGQSKLSWAGSSIKFLRSRISDYIVCEARYSKLTDWYGIYKACIWESIVHAAVKGTRCSVHWKCNGVVGLARCWCRLEWVVIHR